MQLPKRPHEFLTQCPAPYIIWRVRVNYVWTCVGVEGAKFKKKMGDDDVCLAGAGESCAGEGPIKVPVTLAYVLYDQGI